MDRKPLMKTNGKGEHIYLKKVQGMRLRLENIKVVMYL